VKVTALLVPAAEVSVMLLAVAAAVAGIVKVTVTVLSFTTVSPDVVIAGAVLGVIVSPLTPVRPEPARVTVTVLPRAVWFGVTRVRTGASTVNVTGLVVPCDVVTVTFRTPGVAVVVSAKFAVTILSFTTATALAVTPVPDIVTPVAPVRPVPYRVTGMVVARTLNGGFIELSVGVPVGFPPVVVPKNSTAPISGWLSRVLP
jgi:hypothetical protein